MVKTACKYGIKCYIKDPEHFSEYSHPPGHPMNSPSGMTSCKYGIKCYIKDLEHFSEYSHPPEHPMNSASGMTPCKYGIKCYIKDLEHFSEYSHPPEHPMNSRSDMTPCRYGIKCYMKDPDHFKQFSHPPELEKQRKSLIVNSTPIYWGPNPLDQDYHKINIHHESPEFDIITELLNCSIATHGHQYGTVNGRDPTEFIITKISRIHNKKLWREYCFKKETIIGANKNCLHNSYSSKYLRKYSSLAPLLDASANEYWLFHGCSQDTLQTLLKNGYDPRVSSIDSMFGAGFYLAENSSKSNQYIPCTSCGKNAIGHNGKCKCDNQESLEFRIILYRTVLGDVHIAKVYKKEIYHSLDDSHPVRRPPRKEKSEDLYDSVMGESITYGGDLLNYREFILYESGQAYPEYVIQYKRSAKNIRPPSDKQRLKTMVTSLLTNAAQPKSSHT